jgi:uncharacterized protein YbjT (DUF2867 family)
VGRLRVLFVGGTGVISSACVREAVGRDDIELVVLNRGQSAVRPLPTGVREVRADVREARSVLHALDGFDFDCVVDFVAFTAEHVRADIELFRGRTGQYVFISTASALHTPYILWSFKYSRSYVSPRRDNYSNLCLHTSAV